MGTSASQNHPAEPAGEPNAIVFDTSSGISLEEQQEILNGINAMTGGNRMVQEAPVAKAKKKGFLFPMFVNIGAVAIIAGGFYFLSFTNVQNTEAVRNNSVSFGLTERRLIQEIREEASPAMEELMRLGDEREKITRIESLVSGYFTRINNQIEAGRFWEASATLIELRNFLDSPLLHGIRSLEEGRQSYILAVDALERTVAEALRLREEIAAEGRAVLSEALAELNTRYTALQGENSVLTARNAEAAEKEAHFTRLENANISQQETLNRRDTEIVTLRNEREERERRVNELNASLTREIAQKEDLQRQLNDLQGRLDTALRLFQE